MLLSLLFDFDIVPAWIWKKVMGVKDWSQELIDRTIDYLGEDRSSLKACSLLASQWVPRSRRYLFSNLKIDAPGSTDGSKSSYESLVSILESPHCTFHCFIQHLELQGTSAMTWVQNVRDAKPDNVEWLEPIIRHIHKWTSATSLTLERIDSHTRKSDAWRLFISPQQPESTGSFHHNITTLRISHFAIRNSVDHTIAFLSVIPAFPSVRQLTLDPLTDASESVYKCQDKGPGPSSLSDFIVFRGPPPGTKKGRAIMKALKSLGAQKLLPASVAKGSKKKKGGSITKVIPVQVENEELIMDDDGDEAWEDLGSDDDGDKDEEDASLASDSGSEIVNDPDYEPKVSECNCHQKMPPGPNDEQVLRIAENLGAAPGSLCDLTVAGRWLYIPFPLRILWEWLRLNEVTSIRTLDIRLEYMEPHDLPAFARYLEMLGEGLKELKWHLGLAGREWEPNPAPDNLVEGRCECRCLLRYLVDHKVLTKSTGIEEATFECLFFYDIVFDRPNSIISPNTLFSSLEGRSLKRLIITVWTDLEGAFFIDHGDTDHGASEEAAWYAADATLANGELFPVLKEVVVKVTVVRDRNYKRYYDGEELSELEITKKVDKFFPQCRAKDLLQFQHVEWKDVAKERFGVVY
ncbi:hypothetical protein Moror_15086 [Moniliophthora roreri MCA 2997]|uniref:Uncharacterized protein n=1 Tax=Moniliophthora roreri (strain MCA 2997) TaxID=1381753 RepID=V2WNV3_MONRO|nr:hypothetical protein Moror_15086 [Moniliophthora roreri MCA 2997]